MVSKQKKLGKKVKTTTILRYRSQYKECDNCLKINWHRNNKCFYCDTKKFSKLSQSRISIMKKALKDVGNKYRFVAC